MTTDIAPLETDCPAAPDAGLGALATSRGNLPLDTVDVHAAIAGTSASVVLTQASVIRSVSRWRRRTSSRCRTGPR
jgi:hypothetical protein